MHRYEDTAMKPAISCNWIGSLLLLAVTALAPSALAATPQDDSRIDVEKSLYQPGNALEAILAKGVVRIAVPEDFPPFGSLGVDKKLEGYDIDVAHLIARQLGVRLDLVPVRSADRLSLLLAKRVDLVVAGLGISPERARAIAFSSPYGPFFSGVFGAPGVNVKSMQDLTGKRIAVTQGTLEDKELTQMAPSGVDIVRYPDNEATLGAFLSGATELVATGNVVASALAKRNPDRKIERKFVIRESPVSVGLVHGETELRNWVNVFVFYEKANGDLDRLSRKWFGEPLPALPTL
jgi:polar amino acid transport system substrate-binding protein